MERLRRIAQLVAPFAALAVTLYAVELPWFSFGPGKPREVVPRMDLDAPHLYQPEGRLLLTTVNVGRVNAFGLVDAWLDPAEELAPERQVLAPGETDRDRDRESRIDMDESVIAGVAYALRRTSAYPEEHGDGVLVQSVLSSSPADGVLVPGDEILSIDGAAVDELPEVATAIRTAGASVRLRVRGPDDDIRTFRIRPVRVRGRRVMGVVLIASFPFDVSVDTGDVGGPSAGIMWALGALDLLTPGDLTGGRTVAGTGAIDLDGSVGPIGGVEHKVAAAAEAGADVFLLPRENLSDARAVGLDLPLVPVDSVDDAVDFLERGAA